jgi:hypothetical protein
MSAIGWDADGGWEREVPVLVRGGSQGEDKVQVLTLRLALQQGKHLHTGRVRRLTRAICAAWLDLCLSTRGECACVRLLSVLLVRGVAVPHAQVLRVQVTSEADAFFLHTLELCEDDFAALKVRPGSERQITNQA